MAYNADHMIQLSAGETSPDQLAGIKFMSYESLDDEIPATTPGGGQLSAGYFNDAAYLLRTGSLIMLSDGNANTPTLAEVTVNPITQEVTLAAFKLATNVPSPYYETLGEAPVEFLTAGGDTDTFPYADSFVGNYANYSLNSEVFVTGPPGASSGIQYLECQAGQIFVKWLRPAIAGQTVKIWLQTRSATPTP